MGDPTSTAGGRPKDDDRYTKANPGLLALANVLKAMDVQYARANARRTSRQTKLPKQANGNAGKAPKQVAPPELDERLVNKYRLERIAYRIAKGSAFEKGKITVLALINYYRGASGLNIKDLSSREAKFLYEEDKKEYIAAAWKTIDEVARVHYKEIKQIPGLLKSRYFNVKALDDLAKWLALWVPHGFRIQQIAYERDDLGVQMPVTKGFTIPPIPIIKQSKNDTDPFYDRRCRSYIPSDAPDPDNSQQEPTAVSSETDAPPGKQSEQKTPVQKQEAKDETSVDTLGDTNTQPREEDLKYLRALQISKAYLTADKNTKADYKRALKGAILDVHPIFSFFRRENDIYWEKLACILSEPPLRRRRQLYQLVNACLQNLVEGVREFEKYVKHSKNQDWRKLIRLVEHTLYTFPGSSYKVEGNTYKLKDPFMKPVLEAIKKKREVWGIIDYFEIASWIVLGLSVVVFPFASSASLLAISLRIANIASAFVNAGVLAKKHTRNKELERLNVFAALDEHYHIGAGKESLGVQVLFVIFGIWAVRGDIKAVTTNAKSLFGKLPKMRQPLRDPRGKAPGKQGKQDRGTSSNSGTKQDRGTSPNDRTAKGQSKGSVDSKQEDPLLQNTNIGEAATMPEGPSSAFTLLEKKVAEAKKIAKKAREASNQVWYKRRAGKLKDPVLKREHDRLKELAEKAEAEQKALERQLNKLKRQTSRKSHFEDGLDFEEKIANTTDWEKLTTGKGAIDFAKPLNTTGGAPGQVMQLKTFRPNNDLIAYWYPKPDRLGSPFSGKTLKVSRELQIERDIWNAHISKVKLTNLSNVWKDMAKNWNNKGRKLGKDKFGFEMPSNPDNPSIQFELRIEIINKKPPSWEIIHDNIQKRFQNEFPANARLNINFNG